MTVLLPDARAASPHLSAYGASLAPQPGLVEAVNALALRGAVARKSPRPSGPPPSAVALHAPFLREWPARDQFGRGTCVAFAVIAMLELHEAHRSGVGLPGRISEHLFYRLLRQAGLGAIRDGRSTLTEDQWRAGATTLEMALDVLRASPPEAVPTVDWSEPYRPVADGLPVPGVAQPGEVAPPLPLPVPPLVHGWKRVEGDGDPADPAPGGRNAYPSARERTASDLFRAHLAAGHPVAAGFPTFPHDGGHTNWTLPRTWREGRVACPQDAGAPRLGAADGSGHVVCLTGFAPDEDEPSGGWFSFRNSWGLGFGASPTGKGPARVPARGYGILSATHVDLYCWEFLSPALGADAAP